MINAFKYIIKNGGIDTEKSYPYKAHVSELRRIIIVAFLHVLYPALICVCHVNNNPSTFDLQNEKKCLFKTADEGATMSSYTKIKKDSEDDLQTAVGTIGPISVAIDASHSSFQVR